MDYFKDVRIRIAQERGKRNMSQAELARQIGQRRQTVSELEKPNHPLSIRKANRILKLFGLRCELVIKKIIQK